MNARLGSLAHIHAALWQELGRAARERDHAWRHCTLATVAGERADARVVVLREVDAAQRRLLVYTDARSPKVEQIAAHPLGTLVAWSPLLSWQLRVAVRLQVADSGLEVSSRWARVKLSPGAQDYLAALPPGTPVDRYEPERGSREHFAVIEARVESIDWLELHPDGLRRARFTGDEGGVWLAP